MQKSYSTLDNIENHGLKNYYTLHSKALVTRSLKGKKETVQVSGVQVSGVDGIINLRPN